MKKTKLLLQSLAVASITAAAAFSEGLLWKPCTLPQLFQASDLVVLGTVIRIEPGIPGPNSQDSAYIRVDRVLHGSAPEVVRLDFPGRLRGVVQLDGRVLPDKDPALIRYDLDQEGIFFLRQGDDGGYTANHPARFKPSFFLSQVTQHLARAGMGD